MADMSKAYKTQNSAKIKNFGKICGYMNPDEKNSALRVYRNSPTTVAIQIRGEKRYAMLVLNFDEAQELRDAIQRSIDDDRPRIGNIGVCYE